MAPRYRRHTVSSNESNVSNNSSFTSNSTKELAAAQKVFARRHALIKTLGEAMTDIANELGDDCDVQEWELYKALEKYISRTFRSAGEAGLETCAAFGRYFRIRSKLIICEVEGLPGRLSVMDSASHKLWTEKCDAEQNVLKVLDERGEEEDFDVALWLFEETDSGLCEILDKILALQRGDTSGAPSKQADRSQTFFNQATHHRPAQKNLEHLTGYFASHMPPVDPDATFDSPVLSGREGTAPYPWHNLYQPATPSQFLFGTQHRPAQRNNPRKPRKNSAKSKRTARTSTRVPEEVQADPSSTSPNFLSTPSHSESDGGVPLTDDFDLAYGSDGYSGYFPSATKKQETRQEPRKKQVDKGKGKKSEGLERFAQAISGRPPKRSDGREKLTQAASGRPRKMPNDRLTRQNIATAYRFEQGPGRALAREGESTSDEDV